MSGKMYVETHCLVTDISSRGNINQENHKRDAAFYSPLFRLVGCKDFKNTGNKCV